MFESYLNISKPPNPSGDWWELWDDKNELPYYYHTERNLTQWNKPEEDVVSLVKIQQVCFFRGREVLRERDKKGELMGGERCVKKRRFSLFKYKNNNSHRQEHRNDFLLKNLHRHHGYHQQRQYHQIKKIRNETAVHSILNYKKVVLKYGFHRGHCLKKIIILRVLQHRQLQLPQLVQRDPTIILVEDYLVNELLQRVNQV